MPTQAEPSNLPNQKQARNPARKNQTAGLFALLSYDITVLSGHPANLTAHLHSMPAVNGDGDVLEHCPIRHGSDAGVIRTIAHSDVHRKLLAGLFLFPYTCYNIPTFRSEVFPMSSKNDRNSKNDDKKNDPIMIHMATGMSVGMCLGLALGFALQSDNMPPTIFMLFGMSIGMSLGLAIGSMKKKNGNDKEN